MVILKKMALRKAPKTSKRRSIIKLCIGHLVYFSEICCLFLLYLHIFYVLNFHLRDLKSTCQGIILQSSHQSQYLLGCYSLFMVNFNPESNFCQSQVQKKKLWESVQPHLKTTDACVAVLGERPMRTSAGVIVCSSLKKANIS